MGAMESLIERYDNGTWRVASILSTKRSKEVFEIVREGAPNRVLKVVQVPSLAERVNILTELDEEKRARYIQESLDEKLLEFDIQDEFKNDLHIVNCLDHSITKATDGFGYVAFSSMEQLLSLDDDKEMKKANVLQVGIDICKALARLESQNVIHGNVTLENIYVDYLDRSASYKLGNFSLAQRYSGSVRDSLIVGTEGYIAPEIMVREEYDASADLYSLGIVLQRILDAQGEKHLELSLLIKKACNDRKNRYHSATEMLVALQVLKDFSAFRSKPKIHNWKPEEGPPEPIECFLNSMLFGNGIKSFISTFFNEVDEREIQERDKAPIEEVRRTDSIITTTYTAMPIKKKQNAVINERSIEFRYSNRNTNRYKRSDDDIKFLGALNNNIE
jgi:serine/threonine protein kinase